MGKNQIELFCSTTDFLSVLDSVYEQLPLSFAVAGLFKTADVHVFHSPSEISAVIANSTKHPLSFLAVGAAEAVKVREVPQRKGHSLYAVDQLVNQGSVVLRPGRAIDERILLAGQIGTASEAPESLTLFSTISKVTRKHFVKVRSYWVGPEAVRLLDAGGRLIATSKAPPEYDLKR